MAEGRAGSAFLVVDDNADFAKLLEGFVQHFYPGARVKLASSGQEALEHLTMGRYDVVLLDYRLPDFDGLEVLAEIRKRLMDVAVVMVTGEGDESLAADIFRMGAYDYLPKGAIDSASLRRCLDRVVMRRVLETQISEKSEDLVSSSRELSARSRALDTAYEKLRYKKEELRLLSDSLEQTVQERTGELRATSAFLNEVLDSTTDHFIVATRSEGAIATFNRGAEVCFGVGAERMVGGQHFRILFSELESDSVLEEILSTSLEEGSTQRELTGRGSGGREFLAKVTFSRLQVEGEEPPGLVIVGTDVTHERELEAQVQAYIRQIEGANLDLRRNNEQILHATQLKSEFLANVSHELRTPLNAIIGYADLLDGGIYGELEDRQGAAVGGIAARARDLLSLINEILDLAKIEAGKVDLRIEVFELRDLISRVVETGRVLALEKGLEVTWNQQPAGLELRTDRQKLQQILLNLVNNAVKFTPSGNVHIETLLEGEEQLEIRVIDSGIGIPDADLARIFDEFLQVDGTSTRAYGGTGLGLAISQKYALSLGGELTVESSLGEGSVFSLLVPIALPGEPEAADRYVPVAITPAITEGKIPGLED